MRSFLQQLAYLESDIIGREAEMGEHVRRLARGAEPIDTEHPAGGADVTPPAEGGPALAREAPLDRARQHALALGGILGVESLRPRHRHQADPPAGGVERA